MTSNASVVVPAKAQLDKQKSGQFKITLHDFSVEQTIELCEFFIEKGWMNREEFVAAMQAELGKSEREKAYEQERVINGPAIYDDGKALDKVEAANA